MPGPAHRPRPALLAAALAALLALPAAASAAPVADGVYRSSTQDLALALTVRAGQVDGVRLTLRRYVCMPEGDIGPLFIGLPVGARISAGRRGFGFTRGPISERLRVDGRFSGREPLVRGSLQVRGTIGQADPCASRRIRFSARRAR